jgi:ribonuclease BN (tRNA processing enzyme)
MNLEFDFRTWAPGEPVRIGPFTVQPLRVEHPVEAYGLRVFAAGALLAYTGDTGRCGELETLARGADLLLAEASFPDGAANPPGIHLTGGDGGRLARDAGVHRLVVTHVPPWYDGDEALAAARAEWDGPTELAAPGSTYDL